jgi:diguanylate cyclase (GGDEF)-like protein
MDEPGFVDALTGDGIEAVYAVAVTPEPRLIFASQSTAELVGHSPEALYASADLVRSVLVDADTLCAVLAAALPDTSDVPVTLRTADGRETATLHRVRCVTYEDGEVVAYGAVSRVGARPEEAEPGPVVPPAEPDEPTTTRDAFALDALTGLPGRNETLDLIQAALDGPDGVALLCASVDNLSQVNEYHGHEAGDAVLAAVAERLRACLDASALIGRGTGGEFVVLLRGVSGADRAGEYAAAVVSGVRGPIRISDDEVQVTVTVGVALASGGDARELMRDATTAMRQAAAKGGDRWEFLDPERALATRHRVAVQASLRQALADDRIRPWFQPVVNLATETLAGYEALVRWEKEDGTVLEPAQFFDVAERSYLITTLDRIVLSRSLEALGRVDAHLLLATNVSGPTLAEGTFFDFVVEELARTGIAPDRLNLEVTETSLVEATDEVRAGMARLADLGVTWWVDDFGTGYSSISHLRDLPVGGLKLDRSFTMGVASGDQRSIRVAQGLAGLARGLAMRMVVEGVQGERDAAILLGQGWTLAQGFVFGRPSPEMRASA